jgi:RES domain-containing protein
VGDRWLEDGKAALLIVPSVPAPKDWNVVINVAHPDAASIAVSSEFALASDPGLLQASP